MATMIREAQDNYVTQFKAAMKGFADNWLEVDEAMRKDEQAKRDLEQTPQLGRVASWLVSAGVPASWMGGSAAPSKSKIRESRVINLPAAGRLAHA
eukprot:6007811-Prymnesium_polylepis.1